MDSLGLRGSSSAVGYRVYRPSWGDREAVDLRQRRKPNERRLMRALWIVAAMIGLAILIFAHTTTVEIVVSIAFLGLAVFLYRRPLVRRIGLGRR